MGQSATVLKVGHELRRAEEIRKWLREEGDPVLIFDTIEGETELHEAIAAVVEELAENNALITGIRSLEDSLAERRGRLEKSVATLREVITMAMERAQINALKTPLATLSIRPVPPGVLITDESQIPARFFKAKDPTLDKAALNKAVAAGEAVPGTSLSNGGVTLSIRSK